MTRDEIWREFVGEVCGGCHRRKSRGNDFCKDCHFRLPKDLRANLWRRFSDGHEEAYQQALEWLRENNVPIEAK